MDNLLKNTKHLLQILLRNSSDKAYYRKLMKGSVFLLGIYLVICVSCDQELDLGIPEYESQIVVEGKIEQGRNPEILLTLTAPFFTEIDTSSIRDYAVLSAKVTVESAHGSEILIIKKSDRFFPPYVYFGIDLEGEEDNWYTITVNYREKEYTATTTIPAVVYPDSVWFDYLSTSDTLGTVWVRLSDDPLSENYYRILFKRKGVDKDYVSAFGAVFSDDMFNGETIDLSFTRGNIELLETEDHRYFEQGDTIAVKFCSIDKASYDFWNTINAQIISSANPFAASNASVISNIEGGKGVWAGYAVAFDTVYAQ